MDIDQPPPFVVPKFDTVEEQNAFPASDAYGECLTRAFAEGVRRAVAEEPGLIKATRLKRGLNPA